MFRPTYHVQLFSRALLLALVLFAFANTAAAHGSSHDHAQANRESLNSESVAADARLIREQDAVSELAPLRCPDGSENGCCCSRRASVRLDQVVVHAAALIARVEVSARGPLQQPTDESPALRALVLLSSAPRAPPLAP